MRGSKESLPGTARQLHLWVKHSLLPSGSSKVFEKATGKDSCRDTTKSSTGKTPPVKSLPIGIQVSTVDDALGALSGYREEFPVVGCVIEEDDWILDGHAEWQQQYKKSQRLLKELHGGDVDDATFLLELGSRIGLQEFKFASFDADKFGTTASDDDEDDFGDFQAAPLQANIPDHAQNTPSSPQTNRELGVNDSATSQMQSSQPSSSSPHEGAITMESTVCPGSNVLLEHVEHHGSAISATKSNELSLSTQVINGDNVLELPMLGGHAFKSRQVETLASISDVPEDNVESKCPPSSNRSRNNESIADDTHFLPDPLILHPTQSYSPTNGTHPSPRESPINCKVCEAYTPRPDIYNYSTPSPSKTEPKTPTTNNYSQIKSTSSLRPEQIPSSPSRDSVGDEKKQEYNLDVGSLPQIENDMEGASLPTTDGRSSNGVPSVVQLFSEKSPSQHPSFVVPSTVRLVMTATPEANQQLTSQPSPFTPSPNHHINQALSRPLRLSLQLDRQASLTSHSATSLATPEGRFVRRASQMQKFIQDDHDRDDQSSSDLESVNETASLGSLRSFLPDGNLWKVSQSTPSQEMLDQAITDMLNGLEWEWIPYWKLDHLLEDDCDVSFIPLWLDQITQQLSSLDAMHLKISKRLHKLIQPHASDLDNANQSALDLAKNLQLCQMYLERSQHSIHRAKYGSKEENNMESFDGVQGAQQLLRCLDMRKSYDGLNELVSRISRLYDWEQHILHRIQDYDIRLEDSLEECNAIMNEATHLHQALLEPPISRLDCVQELCARAGTLISKTFLDRLHSWLESITVRCCHTTTVGILDAREYERLIQVFVLVERPSRSSKATSESLCTTIYTTLLLEAQKSLGMALLNPTDSENEESEYDKELLALSTKAYLDPSKMAIWTHNLVTIRFDFELSKNHLPLIYHKLCSLLVDILQGHHCLLEWHRDHLNNDSDLLSEVASAVFEELLSRRVSIWNACIKVLEECLEEHLKFASKKKLFESAEDGKQYDSAWILDLIGLEDVLGLTNQFLSLRKEFLDDVQEQVINNGILLREKLFDIQKKHLRAVHIEAMNSTGLSLYKESWSCVPLQNLELSSEGIIISIQKYIATELTKITEREHAIKRYSKSNHFARKKVDEKYFCSFAERQNPFCEVVVENSDRDDLDQPAKLLGSLSPDCGVASLLQIYVGSSSTDSSLLPACIVNCLFPWIGRLLLLLERLPPISEEVVKVFCNLSDLYLTTAFRICCGSSMHEKILLGIEAPKSIISSETISVCRSQEQPASMFGFGRRSTTPKISAIGSSSSLSPTTDAEICSPLRCEETTLEPVRVLILDAQDQLKSIAKLDLVDGWVADANPSESRNLAELACQSARVLERRQASIWGCTFLTLALEIAGLIAKTTFAGHVYGLSLNELENYVRRLVSALPKLVEIANRISCVRAIRGRIIVQQILLVGNGWEESSKLHEHPNQYIDSVCDFTAMLWCSLYNAKKIPVGAIERVWTYVVEGAFASLLDGFSRIPMCSTEGRALMSMDLASLASAMRDNGLQERLKGHASVPKPPQVKTDRGMAYVDTYIKIFYYPPMDALGWIRENFSNYRMNHMVALIVGSAIASSENRKESIKMFIDTVLSLYLGDKMAKRHLTIGTEALSVTSIASVQPVDIWDNVVTHQQCEHLHQLAMEHQRRVDDDSLIFRCRSKDNVASLTPLETAIEAILRQIDNDELDESTVVEYWTRQEYLNLDVHSDIDEEQLERYSTLRYPINGHVLYLRAGNPVEKCDTAVVGPTCIFPNIAGGWGVPQGEDIHLLSVPVVAGRLLRFSGSIMHAVPKPSNRWLYPVETQQEFDDIDEFDDEQEAEADRSVVLFNVWKPLGPMDVCAIDKDYYYDHHSTLPSGIVLDEENGKLNENVEEREKYPGDLECQQRQDWKKAYGQNFDLLQCKPKSKWNKVPILAHDEQISSSTMDSSKNVGNSDIRIALMGKQSRRLYPKKYVNLQGNHAAIDRALKHPTVPYISLLKGSYHSSSKT